MNICIDLTSLADNFSGIERYALSMTEELIKDEDNNFILVFKNEVFKSFVHCSYPNIKKLVIKGSNKLLFNQIKIPFVFRKIKADVFLFLAFPAPFFFSGKRTISMIPDLGMWDCPQTNKKRMVIYFKTMYKRASRGNKRIITISDFTKERIIDILHVKKENIIVAYCGLSNVFKNYSYDKSKDDFVKNKYKLPEKYLLCLSTVEPRKNMSLLIRAYIDLFEENRIDADLVLTGRKGWLVDEMYNNIPSNIQPHIHFTGFIEDDHLPYIYKNSCLFVFPSIYEGFGIPPIEAMSCGTMVICSDAASLPEVCGDAVLYFKSNDLEDLKNTIIKSLSMEQDEIEELKVRAKILANSYNWMTEAMKIKKLVDDQANVFKN
ncbi:MAG: glycosyltransferase family 4 protein [Lachnospiraceae bacterium]|nr:glycosyltransferase family 4 protein [Lachnospiraceae bacterium]